MTMMKNGHFAESIKIDPPRTICIQIGQTYKTDGIYMIFKPNISFV